MRTWTFLLLVTLGTAAVSLDSARKDCKTFQHHRYEGIYKEATEIGCFAGRTNKSLLKKLTIEGMCKHPFNFPLKIEVPEKFMKVMPSMVVTQQCAGHTGKMANLQCSPDTTIRRNITVELMDEKMNRYCHTLIIHDAMTCKPGCILSASDCSRKQEFDMTNCKCSCIPSLEKDCEEKKKITPNYMFHEQSCTCVCNNKPETCENGMTWMEQWCKCMNVTKVDENNISVNTND